MRILLTIPTLAKADGGTVAVVQNLSESLAPLADTVTVLACETEPNASQALPRHKRVNVIRLPADAARGFGGELRKKLAELFSSKAIDVVHNFGLWQPVNHVVAATSHEFRVPLLSSPSGMLARWALRHKPWKKRVGWWLYQRRDLLRAGLLAATSTQETQDIHRMLPGKEIVLIPNGVEIPAISEPRPVRPNGQRTALFLGRIHSIKGLTNLVEAWDKIRPEEWRCIIAGPSEAGHQQELEALLRSHNLETSFSFPGLIEGSRKWELLANADLFILPSYTENFGISAAEALASQLPVITTKGTPWKDLIDHQCGWWVDIGTEPLATALREAVSLSDDQRRQMGTRGRRLIENNYSWDRIARKTLGAYNGLLNLGSRLV